MIQFCAIGGLTPAALSQRRTAMSRRSVCARLGSLLALLLQAPGGAVPDSVRHSRILELRSRTSAYRSGRPVDPGAASRSRPGASSSTSGGRFAGPGEQSEQFLDVFRRSNKFSEVQAVCRSLGDSPLVGLFQAGYAELTAQLRQATPPTRRTVIQSAAGRRTSYLKSLTAVDRALMRASSGGDQQTRKPRAVSRHDGQHRAVYRFVRHGLGDHERVSSRSVRLVPPTWAVGHPASPKR